MSICSLIISKFIICYVFIVWTESEYALIFLVLNFSDGQKHHTKNLNYVFSVWMVGIPVMFGYNLYCKDAFLAFDESEGGTNFTQSPFCTVQGT